MTLRAAPLLAALALLAVAASAPAEPPVFTPPLSLPTPKPEGPLAGGEPSVAYDPTGDGHVYADAPGGSSGVSFWGSSDGGDTWPIAKGIGSAAGGGGTHAQGGPPPTTQRAAPQ